jgi:CheY-like chemotaxis protein
MKQEKLIVRVLIVEDDEERVSVFRRMLKHAKKLPHDCEIRLVWAKNAGAAIGLLERDPGNVYAGIMLDHDLDRQNLTSWDGLFTGKDVVKKIINVVDKDTLMFVHSTNVTGGPKMRTTLEGAGFYTKLHPWGTIRLNMFRDWLLEVCEVVQGNA